MGDRPYELITAKWPDPKADIDRKAQFDLRWSINLIQQIRSARTELSVPVPQIGRSTLNVDPMFGSVST